MNPYLAISATSRRVRNLIRLTAVAWGLGLVFMLAGATYWPSEASYGLGIGFMVAGAIAFLWAMFLSIRTESAARLMIWMEDRRLLDGSGEIVRNLDDLLSDERSAASAYDLSSDSLQKGREYVKVLAEAYENLASSDRLELSKRLHNRRGVKVAVFIVLVALLALAAVLTPSGR